MILTFARTFCEHHDYKVRFPALCVFLHFIPEYPPYSYELCEFLLRFYEYEVVTIRIFHIFISWMGNCGDDQLVSFLRQIAPVREEISDFLEGSNLVEHLVFGNILAAAEMVGIID
jgi:hypothetical protein